MRVLAATVAGTLLAAIGPLGVDALLFPLKALTRSDVLDQITEWQPPHYRSLGERVFLLLVLAAFAAMVRNGRWRLALPTMVFVAAAVIAQRNVAMAGVILVPVLADAAPRLGTLTSRTRPGLGPAFTAICALAAVLAGTVALTNRAIPLTRYPAEPVAWLQDRGIPGPGVRMATQDSTGNLLEVLDGPTKEVFIDDRADMFSTELVADYLALLRGAPRWAQVLDVHDVDVVLWLRSQPLGSLVSADRGWQTVYADSSWTVSCRRGSDACERLQG